MAQRIGRVYSRAAVESRSQSETWQVSAAPAGAEITPVELFDVELSWRECAARTGLRAFRTKVAFVGRIPAPFAKAAPEAAEKTGGGFRGVSHQSSPWEAQE